MSKIVINVVAIVAALLVVAGQGAALATSVDGASQSHSVVVRYADLDLNRPADVRILYRRIHVAADQACGIKELTGSHLPLSSWQGCVTHAVDATVTQLDRPALTAYHREHSIDAARKG